MKGVTTRGGIGVCEELPVITTTSFVSVVISENTKVNCYFPKVKDIKLFVSIQIVLFRQIPMKGQRVHRQVLVKTQASLDRISFVENSLERLGGDTTASTSNLVSLDRISIM